MKKIVIFGGGSGLSQILKGLKLFPVDVTAVVSVSDNGTSTGMLRKDYNIPAVGDISKVMVSMADIDKDTVDLLNYRFAETESIGAHSIKNLMLTALLDLKGNFDEAIPLLCNLLNVKGTILPLTEDNVDLVGITSNGKELVGEAQITESEQQIIEIKYNKDIEVNPKVIKAVKEADLIVFSAGSVLTSILPHLVDEELNETIRKSKAETMYVCNIFTQPGETDDFKVSDHVKLLENYLGKDSINIVVANNKKITSNIIKRYLTKEQKDQVVLDRAELKNMNVKLVSDKLYCLEDGYVRHDSLKIGYIIFSYLMDRLHYDFYHKN